MPSRFPHLQHAIRIAILSTVLPACARTQSMDPMRQDLARARQHPDSNAPNRGADRSSDAGTGGERAALTFTSRADSLAWARARAAAETAKGLRIAISLKEFRLWAIDGADTLLSASVAVANGETVEIQGHRWTFVMPRGVRRVRAKDENPIWVPPDWLYAEAAVDHGLIMARLPAVKKLADGRRIVVRDSLVGLIGADGQWNALPPEEHIVFSDTLYIPPMGTINRRIAGQLGRYRLDLGEGFLLHGTPYKKSIGTAATHGCVRLRDDDLEWLYAHIPVGTKVYIY